MKGAFVVWAPPRKVISSHEVTSMISLRVLNASRGRIKFKQSAGLQSKKESLDY